MLRYMLDTDISIYVIKSRPPELRDRFDRLAEQLCISAITLAELHFGAEKSTRQQENLRIVEEFAARLIVLEFSAEAAAHHGQIRAHLTRTGNIVGPYDMLIGGHARSAGLTLVTNNRREFDRMPGLSVENWAAPTA